MLVILRSPSVKTDGDFWFRGVVCNIPAESAIGSKPDEQESRFKGIGLGCVSNKSYISISDELIEF